MVCMRRIVTTLVTGALLLALTAGSALAGESPWRPERNSPPDPAAIVEYWNTAAQEEVPTKPWLVGYPYDRVPDQAR